ncbi:MAG: TonB-dependent receptor [Halieaceae bacterium]|jgi:iron complex outermembrane receptor protein|nr:TonB-dependent receptor [Halieaceae bacterium]
MKIPFNKSVLVSAVVMASAINSPLLLAQDKSKVTTLMLEEVVVTAQKRAEDTQDVPISISALTETDLERRGVFNAGDLISTLPNMTGFEAPGARGNLSVNMRGVSSGSPSNLSVSPANAMYLDGVYMGTQMGSALDVAELERVEVLRGPQGTLYGRNATGGAVNFITRKPTGEFGGRVTGEVGDESLWGLKATVNTGTLGSVGEGMGALSATFGGLIRQRDELYENTNPNLDDFEDLDREAYRIALRWELNEALTVDYAYDHSKLDEKTTPQFMVGSTPFSINPETGAQTSRSEFLQNVVLGQVGANLATMNQFAPLLGLSPDNTADRFVNSAEDTLNLYNNPNDGKRPGRASSDVNGTASNEADGHALTAALAFDNLGFLQSVEFKSITAYRELKNLNSSDLDGTDNTVAPGGAGAINDSTLGALTAMYGEQLGLFGAMAGNPALIPVLSPQYNEAQQSAAQMWEYIDQFGGGFFNTTAQTDYNQWSQELQMVGTADNIDYALGAYYFSDEGEFRNSRFAAQPVGGHTASNYDNETDAWAVFGQTTIRPQMFDDKLALTLGLRYTEETKDIKYLYESAGSVLLPGPFPGTLRTNPDYTGELLPTAGQYDVKNDAQFSNTSGNVTVAYDVADATNVYLRYATGYRSGGFNGELFGGSPFEEETIETLELGFKSDVIPAVLRVNGAVFAYTFDDQQVSQIVVDENGQTSSFIGNAGKSERWGLELESQWLPTDDLMFSLTYSHIDGDFEEYAPLEGPTTTIDTDDLAKRTSPSNMASGIADWVVYRADWAEFIVHTEVYWQSKSYASALWTGTYNGEPYVFDQIELDSRTIVNMRLGMEGVQIGDGYLRAGLWARNLTDEDYNTFGVNFASLGPITNQYGIGATYGLDVTYEF